MTTCNRLSTALVGALTLAVFVVVPATAACAAARARPNVIVILADDLGYGDTSLFNGWVKTPQIERLASEGDVVELYDLSEDIKETTNVADQYPKRAAEMKAAIEKWKQEVTPETDSQP